MRRLTHLAAAAAATGALALVPLAATALPAAAAAGQGTLSTNQVLRAGQDIVSSNGYYAVVQDDGNFVLYAPGGHPLWASNTVGTGSHDWLAMQGDGNLVLYNGAYPAQGRAVWADGKNGSGTANWLAVQTDGNLVEYTSAGKPVWATNTVQPAPGSLAQVTEPGAAGPVYAYQVFGYPYPHPANATDKWQFYQGQCVSWVAYRLDELEPGLGFSDYYRGPRWGNAGSWGPVASGLKIPVNGTPALGSVAWYGYSSAHPYGHVAYVEQVISSASVLISEMNYDNHNGFRVRIVTKGTSGWPTGFIHIHDR